jgi:radical SAM superfamily enzyme YgiQ (UPF0313 family)
MDPMKNINVAFYSPSIELNKSNRTKLWSSLSSKSRRTHNNLMVNPTPYYLHGYFRKHYPEYSEYIKWKPSILFRKTEDELCDFLIKNEIDVLCVSLYVWNFQHCMTVLKNIKALYNRPLKILVGGPSCDANKDNWEELYPFVDHFVVGQGEKAWANLALDFLGVKVLDSSTPNIVHMLKKGELPPAKQYEYEFIRGIHYSPFIECEDLIHEIQAEYKDEDLAWPYETQRGCPYHCSFCDWNGGQSNKTQKRKEISFIDEIDFMAKNNMCNIHISDANFGMWDVDVEIMKRMIYHNQNSGTDFNFISFNLSKIINDNYRQIMRMIIEYDFHNAWVKLSVQDVHDHVLKAINRPGNWKEAKEVGLEMYKEFSVKKNFRKIFVELILGLPGQTIESYINNLDELYSNGFIPRTYPFLLLRNAPATYDQEYRAEWEIKDGQVFEALDMELVGNTVEEVFNNTTDNFVYTQITSCKTFDEKDWVKMTCADQLYRRLCSRSIWPAYGFIDTNWKHLKPVLVKLMESDDYSYVVEERFKNYIKYGINAMNSTQGKLIANGNDMSSIIYRNLDMIMQSINETGMGEEFKNKFYDGWKSYAYSKEFLNR